MQKLKQLFWLYVAGSFHVAFAVIAFTLISFLYLEKPISLKYIIGVYFATISIYNFLKYFNLFYVKMPISRFYKLLFVGSILTLMISVWCLIGLNKNVHIGFFILFGVVLFYAFPVTTLNIRHFAILKIFAVAVVWTGITLCIPLLLTYNKIVFSNLGIILERFLWVFLLMIPFELRDFNEDKNIKTLVHILGVKKLKWLGYLIILILFIVVIINYKISSIYFLINAIGLLLMVFFIKRSCLNQNLYFSSFWVEALPIFMLFILCVSYLF